MANGTIISKTALPPQKRRSISQVRGLHSYTCIRLLQVIFEAACMGGDLEGVVSRIGGITQVGRIYI